jgi:hypothetical protein
MFYHTMLDNHLSFGINLCFLLSILLCLFIILNIKYFADLSEDTDMVNILVVETLISYGEVMKVIMILVMQVCIIL